MSQGIPYLFWIWGQILYFSFPIKFLSRLANCKLSLDCQNILKGCLQHRKTIMTINKKQWQAYGICIKRRRVDWITVISLIRKM